MEDYETLNEQHRLLVDGWECIATIPKCLNTTINDRNGTKIITSDYKNGVSISAPFSDVLLAQALDDRGVPCENFHSVYAKWPYVQENDNRTNEFANYIGYVCIGSFGFIPAAKKTIIKNNLPKEEFESILDEAIHIGKPIYLAKLGNMIANGKKEEAIRLSNEFGIEIPKNMIDGTEELKKYPNVAINFRKMPKEKPSFCGYVSQYAHPSTSAMGEAHSRSGSHGEHPRNRSKY
jgi:hypothetical protein